MALPLLALLPALTDILDRVLPDKGAADAAKIELLKITTEAQAAQTTAETTIAVAQAGTNSVEAASDRIFVAGWRPFVGWICGMAIGFKFIGGPILFMVAQGLGHPIELPIIDTSELWTLLGGMLGLGTLRTVEKIKGVA